MTFGLQASKQNKNKEEYPKLIRQTEKYRVVQISEDIITIEETAEDSLKTKKWNCRLKFLKDFHQSTTLFYDQNLSMLYHALTEPEVK